MASSGERLRGRHTSNVSHPRRRRRGGRGEKNGVDDLSSSPAKFPASDPLVQISPSWASIATGRKKPWIGRPLLMLSCTCSRSRRAMRPPGGLIFLSLRASR
ncbi:hypothetical protein MTO96_014503 [Rhipicephalus appendiculatus]